MTRARKVYQCTTCKGIIPEGTHYLRDGSVKKYHMDCAPEELLKTLRVKAHYPTARRIMKKVLKTGSVKGFFK